MTHKQVIEWLIANKPGTQWRLSGDVNSQKDLDVNFDWYELTIRPTYRDMYPED